MTFKTVQISSRRPAPRRSLPLSHRRAARPQRPIVEMDDVDALGAHWEAMELAMVETRALRG